MAIEFKADNNRAAGRMLSLQVQVRRLEPAHADLDLRAPSCLRSLCRKTSWFSECEKGDGSARATSAERAKRVEALPEREPDLNIQPENALFRPILRFRVCPQAVGPQGRGPRTRKAVEDDPSEGSYNMEPPETQPEIDIPRSILYFRMAWPPHVGSELQAPPLFSDNKRYADPRAMGN